jgi:hypothetical protein
MQSIGLRPAIELMRRERKGDETNETKMKPTGAIALRPVIDITLKRHLTQ